MSIESLPEPIQVARLLVVHHRPYYAALLWSLIPVRRDTATGLDTMAVDKWGRWYINFEEVSKWPVGQIALAIIHECGHLLRKHHSRMATFEEWMTPQGISLANFGGDLEINDDLKADADTFKTTPPEGWLYPRLFDLPDGLLAEEYCDKLLKKAQKDGRCFSMNHPGQGGAKQKNQGQGQGQGKNGTGTGHCGSCAGGGQATWEEGPPSGTKDGTSGVPGLSEPELDVLRRQVATAIKQHSSTTGRVPAGWKRWAEAELSPPKIPWQKELAAIVRRTQADVQGMVNYSWTKLSRRSTKRVLLPSLRKPRVEAAAVIDTSGSMSDSDLQAALVEFAGVMKVVGLSGMNYIAVDAAAHVSKKVFKASQVTLAGGGGTDMRVGIEAALKLKPCPDFIIVFTDGYTPWPDAPPPNGTKLIAVLTRKGAEGQVPAWMKRLMVEID